MNSNMRSIEIVWDFFQKYLTTEDFHEICIQKFSPNSDNLIQFAIFKGQSSENVEFLWNKVQEIVTNRDEIRKFLLVRNDSCSNILNLSAKQDSFEFVFEKIYCKFFELKEFLFEVNFNGDNFYQTLVSENTSQKLKYATDKLKIKLPDEDFKSFIKTKGPNGQNVFHYAAMNKNIEEILKFLKTLIKSVFGIEELKKLLSEVNNDDLLPLHIAITKHNFPIFIKFYEKIFSKSEIQKLLKCKNLMSLSQSSYNEEENVAVKNVLMTYFDQKVGFYLEFHDLNDYSMQNYFDKLDKNLDIFRFLVTDNCFNIFHFAVEFTTSVRLIEFMLMKINHLVKSDSDFKKILLLRNPQGKNALILSTTLGTSDVFYFLFEEVYCKYFNLEEFIYECDNGGNNLFHSLAKKGTESALEFLSEKLKNKLSGDKFLNYSKLKNKANQNFLHVAAKFNKSIKSVKFLFSLIEKNNEREVLMERDENNLTALHLAVANNTVEIFETLLDYYEKKVYIELFIVYLMTEKNTGKDLFHLSQDSSMLNALEKIKRKMKENEIVGTRMMEQLNIKF